MEHRETGARAGRDLVVHVGGGLQEKSGRSVILLLCQAKQGRSWFNVAAEELSCYCTTATGQLERRMCGSSCAGSPAMTRRRQ